MNRSQVGRAELTHGAVEIWNGLRTHELETLLAAEGRVTCWNNDRPTLLATGIATIVATLDVNSLTVSCKVTPVSSLRRKHETISFEDAIRSFCDRYQSTNVLIYIKLTI